VHCVANVALRIRLNLYKRGFKIYDLVILLPLGENCKAGDDSREGKSFC